MKKALKLSKNMVFRLLFGLSILNGVIWWDVNKFFTSLLVPIILSLIFTSLLYFAAVASQYESNKFQDKLDRIQLEQEQEEDNIAKYIVSSEFFELFQDTPEDLQYDLSKILYYRHLEQKENCR